MQEDQKNISKLGRIRKVHNAGISEATRNNLPDIRASSYNRTTLMPGDITRIQKSSKEKIAAKRQSVMPSQLSLETQKKVETESKETELGLLYDEYLQATMMDLIIKKKTEQKKQLIATQLAAVMQELDQDMKKLIKIKARERDIINLSLAQKEIDAHIAAVKKCTRDDTFNTVKEMLLKLLYFLEPLDVLQCNGIILPRTKDEWRETQEVLTKCSSILRNIANLIRSKGEIYCTVNDGLKKCVETFNEIEDLQKKLKEALCNLQILILKNTSLSLMEVDES